MVLSEEEILVYHLSLYFFLDLHHTDKSYVFEKNKKHEKKFIISEPDLVGNGISYVGKTKFADPDVIGNGNLLLFVFLTKAKSITFVILTEF
jgi:hypothetical protein